MRLSDREVDVICTAAKRRFGEATKTWLFGSRVDDSRRGGDIDILVEADLSEAEAFSARIDMMTDIQMAIGDQKIDIVISANVESDDRLVVSLALKDGVCLQ